MSEDTIRTSDIQTIAAARVTPTDGEPPFIVVSMYAAQRGVHPTTQRKHDWHVDASAHRILSDLSTFVADADREPHRILAAGDLNMDYGADYGWRERSDRPFGYARCRTVWDRMEALGFEYMGPSYPKRSASGSGSRARTFGHEERPDVLFRQHRLELSCRRPQPARPRVRLPRVP